MRFSIITPSFRNSEWLKLCVASVADQKEVSLEHIVQDACSDDGTLDWLPSDQRVTAFVEKDRGMYDAINRGMAKAKGDIFAYLNCDEQYLPGALKKVETFFSAHPDIDLVFGDVVVVNGAGDYAFHRKIQVPLLYHTWVAHLGTLSCAMFFRRRVVEKYGFFNSEWKNAGDAEWMVRLLKNGASTASLGQFTSIFALTGSNLSSNATGAHENEMLRKSAPFWAQAVKPLFICHHRWRRFLGGAYFQKPFCYSLYTRASPTNRVQVTASQPAFRWKW